MQIRFQVNLLLSRDEAFPPLKNLQQDFTVLPLFWAQEGYTSLSDSTLTLMDFAIIAPQVTAICLISGLLLLGGAIISIVVIKYFKAQRDLNAFEMKHVIKNSKETSTFQLTDNRRHEKCELYGHANVTSSRDNTAATDSLISYTEISSKPITSGSLS